MGDADAAVAALGELGGHIALKLSAPGIQHKSDVGAIELGLRSENDVRERVRPAFRARRRTDRIGAGRANGRARGRADRGRPRGRGRSRADRRPRRSLDRGPHRRGDRAAPGRRGADRASAPLVAGRAAADGRPRHGAGRPRRRRPARAARRRAPAGGVARADRAEPGVRTPRWGGRRGRDREPASPGRSSRGGSP